MKKSIVMLVSVMSICCFIGCGSNDAAGEGIKDSQQEAVAGNDGKEAGAGEVESEADAEATSEVAGETADEESTEESTTVVYEGIDMESTLPGEEWIATFIGVIEEPKVVIFNDETGRKEIVETDAKVAFNPDVDLIAVYLPEEFSYAGTKELGTERETVYEEEFCRVFKLNAEEIREKKWRNAAIYVEHDGEEIALTFKLNSQ